MSKILLTGASGKTGEAIYKLLTTEGKHELIALSSQKEKFPRKDNIFSLNMTDKKELKSFLHEHKPEVIINAAAYTDVDGSEDNKKAAMDLNATLVGNLANFCKINESHLITFSTDYIFDGKLGPYTEDALPRPMSYYGKTKLAGENAAKIELSSYTIIRTNIVYGYSSFGKNDFIRWVAGNLKEGKELNIIEGQWGNPTLTDNLAEAVKKILEKKKHGTYNIAGKDWLNRYEL
ncbi:MAG: SDR family oxidoreductase, partial [Bacteroidota bacterium]